MALLQQTKNKADAVGFSAADEIAKLDQQCIPFLAHRVVSRRRSNSVAFGAKRTFSKPRLQNRIYEYAPLG
jgi:hypothetical protein